MLTKFEKLEMLKAQREFGLQVTKESKGLDFARLRKALRLTQMEVAQACCVTQAVISKYERGQSIHRATAMLLWYTLYGMAMLDGHDAQAIVEALLAN